ncbi:MAG: rhodanese-like domain-containing protein [Actinobacteria bacterium]|nr:rhodanese-like domain-containing protein [Actinomycetota bacterium]
MIAIVALVVGYFALGMPGMDHGTGTTTGHDMSAMAPTVSQMSVERFNEAISVEQALVVNVHVPYEGEIDGTDAFVAFDEIENSAELPTDLSQPIRLYCKTGRMSQIAGLTLIQMGYTDVAHLVGGMDAWANSGRTLFAAT